MIARHRIALVFSAALAVGVVSPALAAPEGLTETPATAAAVPDTDVPTITATAPAVITPDAVRTAPRNRAATRAVRVAPRSAERPYIEASYTVASSAPVGRTSGCNTLLCSGRFILLGVGF